MVTTERELQFEKFINRSVHFPGTWRWPRTPDGHCYHGDLNETYHFLWLAFNDGIELRDKSDRENKIASNGNVNGVERLSVFRNKRGQLEPSVGGIRIGNMSSVTVQCDAYGQTTAAIICTNVEIEPG